MRFIAIQICVIFQQPIPIPMEENNDQTHSGSGDNVGRDKIVQHHYPSTDEPYRSDLDAYNAYLETVTTNQLAATSQPIVGKTVADLDKKEVRRFLALPLVKEHFTKHKITAKTPLDQKLRALTLMTNGYVLKGTFFCLAHVSNLGQFGGSMSSASFGVFATLDKMMVRKSEQVYGNLIQQYEELYELLIKELAPMEIIQWNPRLMDYSIPQDVLRELLANAFIHRNYAPDALYRTMIEVYPDRLVIKNSGNFPENMRPDNPATLNSVQRNPEIARAFFLHRFIELQGSGINRVQQILHERGMRPALFDLQNDMVAVTVYKKSF
jgi:predicted HTH transcriptional regulator